MMNEELRTQERNAEKQKNGETENVSPSIQLHQGFRGEYEEQ